MSSLVVGTNVEALNALTLLDQTDLQLSHVEAELASGKQIMSAQDNPAGYVIGQFLSLEAAGEQTAITNANTGISVLQIANGALQQIGGLLQQMYQLAESSANAGTMSSATLSANQQQYSALLAEVEQIATTTDYQQTLLINGSYVNETFQVGPYNTDVITLSISGATIGGTAGVTGLGIAGTSVGTPTAASQAMASLLVAISYVNSVESSVGATQQELQALVQNLTVANQNTQAAYSQIVNVNMAQATTQFATLQILLQSGTAMLAQAQTNPTIVLKLLT
jgi:flagellin